MVLVQLSYLEVIKSVQATQKDLKSCSLLFSVPEAILGHGWRDSIENPEVADKIVASYQQGSLCIKMVRYSTDTVILGHFNLIFCFSGLTDPTF